MKMGQGYALDIVLAWPWLLIQRTTLLVILQCSAEERFRSVCGVLDSGLQN